MFRRVFKLWIAMHTSLWMIPVAMVILAAGLAIGLVALDARYEDMIATRYPALQINVDGARAIFSSVASALMTVTGVVFSITVVALSLAANQYSPRVLRAFMSDRPNQVVLGYFVGVFTYSLLVLRMIRGGETEFVPIIASAAGVLLAIGSVFFLIYFIDHIAHSMHASRIVSSIARRTMHTIDSRFPSKTEKPSFDSDMPLLDHLVWRPVTANTTGYIQSMKIDALVAAAAQAEGVLRMTQRVGDFAIEGMPLGFLSTEPNEVVKHAIYEAVLIGYFRTLEQDPEFGLRQIVDVALKAISPSINDTTTAVLCIDHLTAILFHLAGRSPVESYHRQDGVLRLITEHPPFAAALDLACNQIRQHARGNTAVYLRLLTGMTRLAPRASLGGMRAAGLRQARLIMEAAERFVDLEADREDVRTAYGRLLEVYSSDLRTEPGEELDGRVA